MSDAKPRAGRWIAAALAMTGLAAAFYHLVADNLPKGEVRKVDGYTPWSEATLEVAAAIPVQEGGRVKPLSTYAGFTMLALHGARSMKIEGAKGVRKIKPTEWMLDALFRPWLAVHQPTFRVDNSAALEAIGVKPLGRRDRYSYMDLSPGREKLGELAGKFRSVEAKKRDPLQTQLVDLANNVQSYENLLGCLSFARSRIILRGAGKDGSDRDTDLSELMKAAPEIRSSVGAEADKIPPHLRDVLQQSLDFANAAKFSLFLTPPVDKKDKIWLSPGNLIMEVMSGNAADPQRSTEDIRLLETAGRRAAGDEAAFRQSLAELRDRFAARAKERGEYRHIPLEISHYRTNGFLHALAWFLCGTLAALAMWTSGTSKAGRVLAWVTAAASLAGLGYCVAAIVQRCLIMQRPPVGNLYDTIIFISAAVVLFSLLVEWLTRRRFALGLAPILGTTLVLLARRYELGDANDSMDPLVAVLDSNFWLTTHVITITLGYSAGLLSAFLSAGYLLLRGLGLDGGDKEFSRAITRAVYGMLCFTLFLSLIGTVLGGIWANDSWGRFWGWDPKENGALLIVLWTLAILHARLGGFIRDWGIHLSSVFTAIVVTFSWWHVNFLGVGLHNYGFTAGKNTIWTFYSVIAAVLAFGFIVRALEQAKRKQGRVAMAEAEAS